ASDAFRSAYLASLGLESGGLAYEQVIEETLDGLADHLETHLDLDRILELAR
ncbi:MAG: cobyric acid synthase CobQ, partial [Rhizobiales bacterium]|nr:cobyric acid synthase CobQ [Hyphomicrobiales bacterium]